MLNFPVGTGIESDNIWIALGLLAREGKPLEPYYEILDSMHNEEVRDIDITRRFVTLTLAKNYPAAEAVLPVTMDFMVHYRHFLTGVIIAGENAPGRWKVYVDRLLFANEKPYLPFTKNDRLAP